MKPTALIVACALVALTGCATPTTTPVVPHQTSAAQTQNQNVILSGMAVFPDAASYTVLAKASDVGVRATVSLIEPGGAVRAAGVTDAHGGFVLYQSTEPFVPTSNVSYTLEISKRLGEKQQLLSLRTKLVWDGEKWHSLSSNDVFPMEPATYHVADVDAPAPAPSPILVNVLTTALSTLIDRGEFAALTGADSTFAFPGYFDMGFTPLMKQGMGFLPGGKLHPELGFGMGMGEGPNGFGFIQSLFGEVSLIQARLTSDADPAGTDVGLKYDHDFVVDDASDLEALKHISHITGDLIVRWNGATQNVIKLHAPLLTRVDGNVAILPHKFEDRLTFNGDNTLTVSGLNNLAVTVEGDAEPLNWDNGDNYYLYSNMPSFKNTGVTSLEGLGALKSIGKNLIIVGTTELKSLKGLSRLSKIGGSAFIAMNKGLFSFTNPAEMFEFQQQMMFISLALYNNTEPTGSAAPAKMVTKSPTIDSKIHDFFSFVDEAREDVPNGDPEGRFVEWMNGYNNNIN